MRGWYLKAGPLLPVAVTLLVSPGLPAMGQCQVAKLTADDGAQGDRFGFSVAASGDTVVVGAKHDDDQGSNSGSAYVFHRIGSAWSQVARLTADDAADDDLFGYSVAVGGDLAIVGARWDDDHGARSGSAYIFERNRHQTWSQVAKLIPDDGEEGDYFGHSVAISGNMAVVGAPHDSDNGRRSGSAYVFERDNAGAWPQVAKLLADDGDAGDHFGHAIGIDGDVIVIGARDDDDLGSYAGSAYVFERSPSGDWSQVDKLLAEDGGPLDAFGESVAVSGELALIGASLADGMVAFGGAAYVFERAGDGDWTEVAKLMAADGENSECFGYGVALSGDVSVVGARWDDELGFDSGSAYVFVRNAEATWSQVAKLTPEDGAPRDQFGFSAGTSGTVGVIGAVYEDAQANDAGSAYVFAVGPDEDGDGVMDACECPADLNKDWIVDYLDVLVLLEDWGCTGGDCPGDCDLDGDTDHGDLGLLLANWGNICP